MSGALGISAVLSAPIQAEAMLDLAAVLDGLFGDRFEIVIAGADEAALADLRLTHPNVPLRAVKQDVAAAVSSARHELVLLTGSHGEFDASQLNHFVEAIESGADLALGYRRWTVGRLAWSALGHLLLSQTARDVNCPFKLFRRVVWQRTSMEPHAIDRWFGTRLVVRARRQGFRVVQLPVHEVQTTLARRAAAARGEVRTRPA